MKILYAICLLLSAELQFLSAKFLSILQVNKLNAKIQDLNSFSDIINLEKSVLQELDSYGKLYNEFTKKKLILQLFDQSGPTINNLNRILKAYSSPINDTENLKSHIIMSSINPRSIYNPYYDGREFRGPSWPADIAPGLESTVDRLWQQNSQYEEAISEMNPKSIYNPAFDGQDSPRPDPEINPEQGPSTSNESSDNDSSTLDDTYASESQTSAYESVSEDSSDSEEDSSDSEDESSPSSHSSESGSSNGESSSESETETPSESDDSQSNSNGNDCRKCSRLHCAGYCGNCKKDSKESDESSDNDESSSDIETESSSQGSESSSQSSSEESDGTEDFYFDDQESFISTRDTTTNVLKLPTRQIRSFQEDGLTKNVSFPELRLIDFNPNSITEPSEVPPKSIMQILKEHFQEPYDLNKEIIPQGEPRFHNEDHNQFHSIDYTSAEAMAIKEMSWNHHFLAQAPVSEWVSLDNKAVGRSNNMLTLVAAAADGFKVSYQEIAGAASGLHMVEWWSEDRQCLLDLLVTAEDARVNWYHFSGDGELELLWSWELGEPAERVLVFQLGDTLKVLISFKPSIVANEQMHTGLYGAKPFESWWLEQRLSGGGEAAVLEGGRYLALSQPAEGSLHFYVRDQSLNKYSLRDTQVLAAPALRRLRAFSSGVTWFLAVASDRPAIYRLRGDTLVETEVHDYLLDSVQEFLPLTVDYLRNSAVLLVQQSLKHGSHTSDTLEALAWSGGSGGSGGFQLLAHAPCHTDPRRTVHPTHGFTCLLETEGHAGVTGAAPIALPGGRQGLLLAGEDRPPLLFDVETELISQPDPMEQHAKHTLQTIDFLYEKFKTQNLMLDQIKSKLSAPRQLVGRRWKVRTLRAPAVHIHGDISSYLEPESVVLAGDKIWLKSGSDPSLAPDYKHWIAGNNDRIKQIIKLAAKAVKLSDSPHDLKAPIVFNGGITVHGDVVAQAANIGTINSVAVDRVLRRDRRLGDDNKIHIPYKQYQTVSVNKLFVSGSINGYNIFQKTNSRSPLVINSDVTLDKTLNVTSDIMIREGYYLNNIDVANDIVRLGYNELGYRQLAFEQLEVKGTLGIQKTLNNIAPTEEGFRRMHSKAIQFESSAVLYDTAKFISLNVEGDMSVKKVNGRNWETIEGGLIFKNSPNILDELHIKGKVFANEEVHISKFNSLNFPDEYISDYNADPIIITGKKIFTGHLEATDMECAGTINSIIPSDIVTLSTEQVLGNVSFIQLIVTDSIAIGGRILGKELKDISENPTLKDNNKITSNMIMKSLQVSGQIVVRKSFNDTNLNHLQSEIFMNNQKVMKINSLKHFGETVDVENTLKIMSNQISGVNIDELLRDNENVNYQSNITLGNVIINKLYLNGSFANTNFTTILHTAVYAKGKSDIQKVHGCLTFYNQNLNGDPSMGDNNYYDDFIQYIEPSVNINNLMILKTCNNMKIEKNVLNKNISFVHITSKNTKFKHFRSRTLYVHGDIYTNNMVAGVNLQEFDNVRLSKTRDQVITGNFVINNCTSFGNIIFEYINNYPSRDVITSYNKIYDIVNEIFSGRVPIGRLEVNSLITNGINSKYLNNIADNAINLNEENIIYTNLTFLDPIEASELELSGYFCNEFFPNFLSDAVLATDNPIVIYGKIEYSHPLYVTENISTKYLNNIDVDMHLLDKGKMTNVQEPVRIMGDVIINGNLNITGYYNNEYFSNVNMKVPNNKTSILQGNVYFNDGHIINNLNLKGLLNNKYQLQDAIESIVKLDERQNVEIDMIFTKQVLINSTLDIAYLYNSINLQTLLREILHTDKYIQLEGIINFKEPITFQGELALTQELASECINNIYLSEWRENAILKNHNNTFIGRQRFKRLTLQGNINTNYLNKIALNNFFVETSEQSKYNNLHLDHLTVRDGVDVDGLVNSANITYYYTKSLLKHGSQVIEAPITSRSEVIAKSNIGIEKINDKATENLISLTTAQTLRGIYYFKGNTSVDNIEISGTLNNVYINDWVPKIVLNTAPRTSKIVNANITVDKSTFLENMKRETGEMNDENLTSLYAYLDQARNSLSVIRKHVQQKSESVEEEMTAMKKKRSSHLNKIKYVEQVQNISNLSNGQYIYIETDIRQILVFENGNECLAEVWQWQPTLMRFRYLSTLETGKVTKWLSIALDGKTFVLNNVASSKCKYSTSNLWQITENAFELVATLPPAHELLSVDKNGVLNLKSYHTRLIKGYRIKTTNGTFKLEEFINYQPTDSTDEENVVEITFGRFQQNISVHILPSKLEVHLQNKIDVIEASKPNNVHLVPMNDLHNLLIFTDDSGQIHVYEYWGMAGYRRASVAAAAVVPAADIQPLALRDVTGARALYLLVASPHSLALKQLVTTN